MFYLYDIRKKNYLENRSKCMFRLSRPATSDKRHREKQLQSFRLSRQKTSDISDSDKNSYKASDLVDKHQVTSDSDKNSYKASFWKKMYLENGSECSALWSSDLSDIFWLKYQYNYMNWVSTWKGNFKQSVYFHANCQCCWNEVILHLKNKKWQ